MTLVRAGIRRKPASTLGQFFAVKARVCQACRCKFTPDLPGAIVCSEHCALSFALSENGKERKAQAVKERKADAVKRQGMKSRQTWLKECQVVVNKVVRLRDMLAGHGCITCGARPAQKVGGTMDAGHFRSVGSAPHLRFFTPQIALQCVTCNRYQGGRALDFRKALVLRHGAAWVDALEGRQELAKFDIAYLQRLKAVFAKLARRLEKRIASKGLE